MIWKIIVGISVVIGIIASVATLLPLLKNTLLDKKKVTNIVYVVYLLLMFLFVVSWVYMFIVVVNRNSIIEIILVCVFSVIPFILIIDKIILLSEKYKIESVKDFAEKTVEWLQKKPQKEKKAPEWFQFFLAGLGMIIGLGLVFLFSFLWRDYFSSDTLTFTKILLSYTTFVVSFAIAFGMCFLIYRIWEKYKN